MTPVRQPASRELDPQGSLVDADMGAYYNAESAADCRCSAGVFSRLATEGHGEGPDNRTFGPRGTAVQRATDFKTLLSWIA